MILKNTMKINDIYNVKIIDNDLNGNGVTRINNKVLFVPFSLKDEELKVKIIEVKKNYSIGEILEVVHKSNYRCDENCDSYYKCGGCVYRHTLIDNERNIKKEYLNKLFKGSYQYITIDNIDNYRNKAVFHVKEGRIGFYNSKTHDLVEFENCKLLDNRINFLYKELNSKDLNGIYEIIIRCTNKQVMVKLIGDNINSEDFMDLEVDSFYINDTLLFGSEFIIDEVDNIKFSIYPDAFYQVNMEGMKLIYNEAKRLLGSGKNLLDLYCGTGTIAIWLKDNFKHIDGVEINSDAVRNANINKELNSINNINFICDDAKNIKGYYDSIIVDPPRNGLSKNVIDFLNNSGANKIVYISCNPMTLKRDIELLNKYKIEELSFYEMFPRTGHVETVVLMSKVNTNK